MARHDREDPDWRQQRRQRVAEWGREVLGREDLRDRFQDFAQTWFDRNGQGVDGPAGRAPMLPAPAPKTDYTPFYIAGAATLLAAFIVTRKK